MSIVATGLLLLGGSAAGQVLGMDAAGPLQKWAPGLSGIDAGDISIRQRRVNIAVGDGCVLALTHPKRASCAAPVSVGNATVCWSGKSCPDGAKIKSALQSAGPIKLPWMTPSGGQAPDSADLGEVRKKIGLAFWRNGLDEVRSLLEPVLKREDLAVDEWSSLLPLASRVGLGGEALKLLESAQDGDMPLPLLVGLKVAVLMGPDMGADVLVATMSSDTACSMSVFGAALVDMRSYGAALTLNDAIRQSAPDCVQAYLSAGEAATRLQKLAKQKEITEAALARFQGDERLGHLEDAYLMEHGRAQEVLASLEKRLAGGDTDRLLLEELLAFYVQEEGRSDRVKKFIARAKADAEDKVSPLIAGVLLAHEGNFARSQLMLDGLQSHFGDNARLYLTMATNAFNLGRRLPAERFILKAEELSNTYPTRDADVPAAVAEIFRDSDRDLALKAVAAYLLETNYGGRADSDKRKRVRAIQTALKRCIAAGGSDACEGPWEHFFDQVGLHKAEKDQAAMVAELKEKGLIGTGSDGPPADLVVPPGMTRPPADWEPGMESPPGMDPPTDWGKAWPSPGGLPAEFDLPPGIEMPKAMEMPEGFKMPEGWTFEDGIPPGMPMPEGFKIPEGWKPTDGPPPGMELPPGFEFSDQFDMPEGFAFPEGWQYGIPEHLMGQLNVPEGEAPYQKRAPIGMGRGVPFDEAIVPGSMPPGYQAPKGWKPGDPLLPGMTPPDVQNLRDKEAKEEEGKAVRAQDPGDSAPPPAKAKDP